MGMNNRGLDNSDTGSMNSVLLKRAERSDTSIQFLISSVFASKPKFTNRVIRWITEHNYDNYSNWRHNEQKR
jgi:hypothetical protein